MKIFQKLSLAVLSSAFLLGAVGVVSLRANSQVKANVDQAVLKGNKTTNLLANIQVKLRAIESQTYHYFLHNKSGLSAAHLEEHKQEILEIIPQLEHQLSELDELSEEMLRFDMHSSLEEKEEGEAAVLLELP